jgi:putative transposase
MNLVEIHNIKKSNDNWKIADRLCFLSKNLYNQALWEFNKHYKEKEKTLRYNDMEKLLKNLPDEINNYKLLTPSVSQQVLMIFDKNIKSFFSLLKVKDKLNGHPKIMKFKHKEKGRNIVVLRGDKNVCKVKDGFIHFPKKLGLNPIKSINVKCQKDLIQVRIVPQTSTYKIEIIYRKEEIVNWNGGLASIDLGINNLATLVTDKSCAILNGRDLKSINHYYNKKRSKLQSELEIKHKKKYSKNLNKLTEKRNNKVKDLLHKKSRQLVNKLKEDRIKNLVIGYNKEWKNGINLGRKTNQTFVSIPYTRFIDMIKYKCTLEGINVIINEESYTSKCSALDLEPVKKQEVYLGRRIKRGLFKTSNGILINSDINGALNIGRKVFGDDYFNPANRGFVLNPVKIY